MDRIVIDDLLVRCIIGIDEQERRDRQDVLVSLSVYTGLAQAGRSDRIEDSVDYRGLKRKIVALAENSAFHLIEALAESIAALCLAEPAVARVRVRVDKPYALRFARTVAVEIMRVREEDV